MIRYNITQNTLIFKYSHYISQRIQVFTEFSSTVSGSYRFTALRTFLSLMMCFFSANDSTFKWRSWDWWRCRSTERMTPSSCRQSSWLLWHSSESQTWWQPSSPSQPPSLMMSYESLPTSKTCGYDNRRGILLQTFSTREKTRNERIQNLVASYQTIWCEFTIFTVDIVLFIVILI